MNKLFGIHDVSENGSDKLTKGVKLTTKIPYLSTVVSGFKDMEGGDSGLSEREKKT